MSKLPQNEYYMMIYSKSAGYLCLKGYRYFFKNVDSPVDPDVYVEKIYKTGLCPQQTHFLREILPHWRKTYPDAEIHEVEVMLVKKPDE